VTYLRSPSSELLEIRIFSASCRGVLTARETAVPSDLAMGAL